MGGGAFWEYVGLVGTGTGLVPMTPFGQDYAEDDVIADDRRWLIPSRPSSSGHIFCVFLFLFR